MWYDLKDKLCYGLSNSNYLNHKHVGEMVRVSPTLTSGLKFNI